MIELAKREVVVDMFQRVGTPMPVEMVELGNAWSFTKDGEVLAVIGVQEMWPSFGQGWVLLDHEKVIVGKHSLWITRQIRDKVREEMSNFRQVRGFCFYHHHVKWARLLGFELEGVWLEAGPTRQNVYTVVYHRRH